MVGKFKTAKSKVGNEFSKFENRLKKLLSPEEHSSTPRPDEPCAQNVDHEIAALQNSFANCTEQAPKQSKPGTSTKASIEISQSLTNISHAFPATPPKPAATLLHSEAQDTQQKAQFHTAFSTPQHSTHSSNSGYSTPTPIDKLNTKKPRNTLTRSNSLPSSPSTTPVSSITFLNTPRHSLTSPFPTPIKFPSISPKDTDPNKSSQNALAEYLQDEESQAQDTDWAALVQWISFAHRAEMAKLTQQHAVELEQLCRDRDRLRDQLEMRSGTSVEAESEEGFPLGCVYPKVVLGFQILAWFLRRPKTFY